ncbi:MAG: HAD-IC family P-type ATPase [Bryobacteraceae bacterium]|nr:HAD-IC family P-type ATPase [Bryobacteraceae bacterium]
MNLPRPADLAACACPDEAAASIWWRIGGGAFLAMNGMVFSLALNGSEVTPEERYALELTSCFIALPVFILLSHEFFTAAWKALRRWQISLELLFLLGIVSCLTASVLYFVRGTGNGYTDVAAMLLVIYSLGRQIGAYGKQRVLSSLKDWAPGKRLARRTTGEMVTAAAVETGDRIRVLPGEVVPVDCRVIVGSAFVQETSLTGESLAVSKSPGDALLAGSFAVDGSLDAVVTTVAGENQLDQIRALIEAGLSQPGDEQRLAMLALRWFVPFVGVAMLATFLFQRQWMPWDQALFVALSVAVIACPCALGFATPLAVWTAIARLRELGILVRSGQAIERLAEIDTVVFDKTGTLTLPQQYDVTWTIEPAWLPRANLLRYLLREGELASRHALSRTLAPLWQEDVQTGSPLRQVRLLPGAGIEASFEDGTIMFAGAGISGSLIVRVNDELAARIELREQPAAGVSPAVTSLEELGVEVILSTGDAAERADRVPIRHRLVRQSPTDKHALVGLLQRNGRHVLFVGDGMNDTAAMAWSHVACAAPESADLVHEVSGAAFLHRDWSQLAPALRIARKTRQVVRWNIAFSLTYNVIGIAFAAAGYLPPVASALLMLASSLTIILYSMHLMDWEPPG